MTAPLSPTQFTAVLDTIRTANLHMRRAADSARASYSPKGHAHRRARKLQLGVNVIKAANCPQRQVSIIPLPIIDISPSPTSQPETTVELPSPPPLRRRPALKCAIPSGGLSLDETALSVLLSSGSATRARRDQMWRGAHRKSATIGSCADLRAPRLSIDMTPVFSVAAVVPSLSEPAMRRACSRPALHVPPATDRPRADVPVDAVEDTWEDISLAEAEDGLSPASAFLSDMSLCSSSSSFGDLVCSPRGTTWYNGTLSEYGTAPTFCGTGCSLSSQGYSSDAMLITLDNSSCTLKRKSFDVFEGRRPSKCARINWLSDAVRR